MAVLKIVEDGHPALKTTCRKVVRVTEDIQKLAEDMAETMRESAGVGLAANQVGEDIRMIAVYDEDVGHKVYVNPKIVKRSRELEYSDEGCLSFPRLVGVVGRALDVIVMAQNLDMKKVRVDASGLLARVFQHEIDHLNGIAFVERVEEGTLRRILTEEELAEKERENAAKEAAAAGGAADAGTAEVKDRAETAEKERTVN